MCLFKKNIWKSHSTRDPEVPEVQDDVGHQWWTTLQHVFLVVQGLIPVFLGRLVGSGQGRWEAKIPPNEKTVDWLAGWEINS